MTDAYELSTTVPLTTLNGTITASIQHPLLNTHIIVSTHNNSTSQSHLYCIDLNTNKSIELNTIQSTYQCICVTASNTVLFYILNDTATNKKYIVYINLNDTLYTHIALCEINSKIQSITSAYDLLTNTYTVAYKQNDSIRRIQCTVNTTTGKLGVGETVEHKIDPLCKLHCILPYNANNIVVTQWNQCIVYTLNTTTQSYDVVQKSTIDTTYKYNSIDSVTGTVYYTCNNTGILYAVVAGEVVQIYNITKHNSLQNVQSEYSNNCVVVNSTQHCIYTVQYDTKLRRYVLCKLTPIIISSHTWSINQVCEWIQSLGSEYVQYAGLFAYNGIDGKILHTLVDSDLLVKCNMVNTTHRKRILDGIENLEYNEQHIDPVLQQVYTRKLQTTTNKPTELHIVTEHKSNDEQNTVPSIKAKRWSLRSLTQSSISDDSTDRPPAVDALYSTIYQTLHDTGVM